MCLPHEQSYFMIVRMFLGLMNAWNFLVIVFVTITLLESLGTIFIRSFEYSHVKCAIIIDARSVYVYLILLYVIFVYVTLTRKMPTNGIL